MTQDEIIEMARQAGLEFLLQDNWMYHEQVETFAKLVANYVSRELAKECAGSGEWNAVHIIEAVRW